MQSEFNVGNLVRVNSKNQTRLWMVLVGFLFSSMLLGQRVNVIDQKGTKASTGVEYTESTTQPFSPIEGDIWKNTTDGLLYVYDGTNWVIAANDLALNDLNDVNTSPSTNDVLVFNGTVWIAGTPSRKKARYVNGNGRPVNNPLTVGLGTSQFNGSGKYDYINIDEFDIIIMGNPSGNNHLLFEDLNASYNGKIITVVEDYNQNPIMNINGTLYDGSSPSNYDLFDSPAGTVYHEAIEFIWQWDTSNASGDWFIMR